MTLIELVAALATFGCAIVGLIAGCLKGWLCGVFGLIAGGLIGITALATLVGIPILVLARTKPVSEEEFGTRFQTVAAVTIFVGALLSVPAVWAATIAVVNAFSAWLNG